MYQQEQEANADGIARRFISTAQYLLVAVFGILPLFFVPILPAPFTYSKIMLILVGVLCALILYGFAVLRSGAFEVRFSWVPALLWMIAFVALVSSLLSGDMHDTLVGSGFDVHSTSFVALMALVASAWMVLGNNKIAVMRLFILLSASTLVLSIFHIVRLLFGAENVFPSVFSPNPVLSPLGGWNDLAIFFGVVITLALVALEQLRLKIVGKVLFAAVIAAGLVMLAVINFFAVWVVLALVSLTVVIYALTKDRFGAMSALRPSVSGVSVVVSLIVLFTSTVFILGGSAAGGFVGRVFDVSYIEVRPSLSATADIVRTIYGTDMLFGIGPNRFADAWRLSKDESINTTIFWNTDFPSGFGYIPTFFATTGIIGGVLWCAFFVVFVTAGLRTLLRTKSNDRVWYFIATASFVGGMYLWLMSIVYVPGAALLLITALCTGLLCASSYALSDGEVRLVNTRGNRRMSFVLVASFLIFIVGSVSVLYFSGRHYVGAYAFNESMRILNEGGTLDESVARAVLAYERSRDDFYARRIAEYEVLKMQTLMTVPEPTDEQRQEFSSAFETGLAAAQRAVADDDSDPRNWHTLANVYAMLVPARVEGAYDRAHEALTRAREYDPKNPSRELAFSQLAFSDGRKDEAREGIERALSLKSNYSDAIFLLAQLDVADGNISSAIESARAITALEPQNPIRFFQLGLLYSADERWADAAAALERAVALDGQYANARYYLAISYDGLSRTDDARRELEAVLALNPGNTLVTDMLARLERGERLAVPEIAPNDAVPEEGPTSGEDGTVEVPNGETETDLVTPVNTPTE